MRVLAMATPTLGDTTYLAIHDRAAVLIDPQRDIDQRAGIAAGVLERQGVEARIVIAGGVPGMLRLSEV